MFLKGLRTCSYQNFNFDFSSKKLKIAPKKLYFKNLVCYQYFLNFWFISKTLFSYNKRLKFLPLVCMAVDILWSPSVDYHFHLAIKPFRFFNFRSVYWKWNAEQICLDWLMYSWNKYRLKWISKTLRVNN